MRQNELKKQEERKKELEMLALKKEVDAEFTKNEAEKRLRRYKEARELGDYRQRQAVSFLQRSFTYFNYHWEFFLTFMKLPISYLCSTKTLL